MKEGSRRKDLSAHTPLAAEIKGPPFALSSAKMTDKTWEATPLSSSEEEASRRDTICSLVASEELAAMKLRAMLIDAGENTTLVFFVVVAATCLASAKTSSF